MAAEGWRPRAAYRAVYLSSPLKCHSTLHAFTRAVPRFHIGEWKKDPHAWEKYKWQTAKERSRGRWSYRHGPLEGVQVEGWPEPGLLGVGQLVQVAARAQAENLQDRTFWHQVAERSYKLRDVISVGDVAVLLDALVTADHRHLLVLKTLAREVVDDADKLSLVEVAVVANAYSHFNCVSRPLLQALAKQVENLLSENPPPFVPRGGDSDADPGSFSVILKAFVALRFHTPSLLRAINLAVTQRAAEMPFAVLAETLACFARLGEPFVAERPFWETMAAKVPKSRMASLCPAFQAVAQLGVAAARPQLREVLVKEILLGVRDALASSPPEPFGEALGLWGAATSSDAASTREQAEWRLETLVAPPALPAFVAPAVPQDLFASPRLGGGAKVPAAAPGGSPAVVAEGEEGTILEFPKERFGTEDDLVAEPDESGRSRAPRIPRWYSTTAGGLLGPAFASYHKFDPEETFNRNRRGARVGEALEGLNTLWRHEVRAGPMLPFAEGAVAPAVAALGAVAGTPAPAAPATATRAAPTAVAGVEGTAPFSEGWWRPPQVELELAAAAAPVLRGAVQGLSPRQLVACVELYAVLGGGVGREGGSNGSVAQPAAERDTVRDLVQEAVRRLSNFSAEELLRLWDAALLAGVSDPYLERARRRRFPKALRKQLRDEEAAAAAALTGKSTKKKDPLQAPT